ncbi:MAG: hypothetical protein WCW66_06285 [Patescibacteria group bacterium]
MKKIAAFVSQVVVILITVKLFYFFLGVDFGRTYLCPTSTKEFFAVYALILAVIGCVISNTIEIPIAEFRGFKEMGVFILFLVTACVIAGGICRSAITYRGSALGLFIPGLFLLIPMTFICVLMWSALVYVPVCVYDGNKLSVSWWTRMSIQFVVTVVLLTNVVWGDKLPIQDWGRSLTLIAWR